MSFMSFVLHMAEGSNDQKQTHIRTDVVETSVTPMFETQHRALGLLDRDHTQRHEYTQNGQSKLMKLTTGCDDERPHLFREWRTRVGRFLFLRISRHARVTTLPARYLCHD